MLQRIWPSASATKAAVGAEAQWSRASLHRRVAAPVNVAAWRVARRPARIALVAAGVTLATAALVAVSASTLVLRDRALRSALEDVPPEQLSFRADEFGLSFSASRKADKAAVAALGLVTKDHPVRAVELRPLRFERHLVSLTAVEQMGRFVRLESGRLPESCVPNRCEVLELGNARLPRELSSSGLRLVVVGTGLLVVPSVLGDFAEPSTAALVVASDVDGVASLPQLQSIFRTASWIVPFEPGEVHEWEVQGLLGHEAHAQAVLEQADPAFKLTAPDDAFSTGKREGRLGTRRMLLVGGEIAVLLLAFSMLTAISLRRTLHAEWRRLEERGAKRSQLWLFLAAETGMAALAGALVGGLVGVGVAGWIAERAGVRFGELLAHGVWSWGTLLLVGSAWATSTLLLVLAGRETASRHAGPLRVSDVVALGALATALVAAFRGGANADALAGDRGTGVLLLLFPGLVSLFAALAALRLLAPLLRLAERVARRGRPSLRLALLALARTPARPAAAVAFLVVSLGFALLAAGYRATLERGVRDEAAYQVPLDYTVTEGVQAVARVDTGTSQAPLDYAVTQGTQPVAPLDAAPLAAYRRVAPGVQAYPVLRRYGDVPGLGTSFASPVLLGLDPGAIRGIHGWRGDFGSPPGELADLLGREPSVRLQGARLPPGTTGFGLSAKKSGADVDLAVAIVKPSGEIVTVPLVAAGVLGAGLGERVPPRGRVVALELSLTPAAATAIAHSQAEGAVSGAPPLGTIELGPLVAFAGGRRLGVVTDWAGWIGRQGARRLPSRRVRVRFGLSESQSALFRPRQPTDGHPIPIVVSPDVARSAAPGGLVTIENGEQHVSGRIVAVIRRFPGTEDGDGSFVVADESHLQTALDADAPGAGRPIEIWLSVPARSSNAVDTALTREPFSPLSVSSRRGVEDDLRGAPLSRSIEIALVVGAIVALALAVCGIWLTLLGDVADERGELYDLEAQGATPAMLRTQLRLRVAILAALGVAGGIVLGLVLAREVVRLLRVTASGEAPIPPLVRETGFGFVALGLLVLVLVGATLVELTARRAFRGPTATSTGGLE